MQENQTRSLEIEFKAPGWPAKFMPRLKQLLKRIPGDPVEIGVVMSVCLKRQPMSNGNIQSIELMTLSWQRKPAEVIVSEYLQKYGMAFEINRVNYAPGEG